MKRTLLMLFVMLFAFSTVTFAGIVRKSGDKKKRDDFYSVIQTTFGFTKADCRAVRSRGYAPHYALILLCIAKEAGRPIGEICGLRDKDGYSWADMCEKYNIDYPALMDRIKAEIIKNNLIIPQPDSAEMKKTIATVPKKGDK